MERYEYDVYGAAQIFDTTDTPLTASAIGNPYLFTGRRYDPESGNDYYRARMYSPTLGRFLQMDPLGYVDGLNLYTYVGNNPGSLVDPYGLMSIPIPWEEFIDWALPKLVSQGGLLKGLLGTVGGSVVGILGDAAPVGETAEELQALYEEFQHVAAMMEEENLSPSSTSEDEHEICSNNADPGDKRGPDVTDKVYDIYDTLRELLASEKAAEREYRGQYGVHGECIECAKLGQGMWDGDIVNVMPPDKYQHFVLRLPDGRIYDPSYLGNFRGYNDEYVPKEILDVVGDNDTFSPELYEGLRKALEEVFPIYP